MRDRNRRIPAGAVRRADRNVAEGEATGHFHGATAPSAVVFDFRGIRILDAPQGTLLRHQEHKPIPVAPAVYDRTLVREFDHLTEEARAVAD
jgi:hypothetical protein